MKRPMQASKLILLLATAALALSFAVGTGSAVAKQKRAPGIDTAIALGGTKSGDKCARRAAAKARRAAARVKRTRASRRVAMRVRKRVRKRCQAGKQGDGTSSAVRTEAPGNLVVGIDGGYTGWSDSEIQQRVELGAAVTRHEWDIYEPVDEQDDVMEIAVGTIHTRIHALLGENDLGDATHYREWVISFIRRYGPGGQFWAEHPEYDASRYAITSVELGNEPYFGQMTPDEYAAAVGPTLVAIRQLALPVQVILPSRVYGSNTSWMDTLYARIPNLNELFYAFADHPYWYGHDPATPGAAGPFERIETLRERMNELGAHDKPIWITEYGESTASCGSECVDEGSQAAHLEAMLQAIVTRPDWGVKMLSVFQLRDRGTNHYDRERQFGLLRENGTAKPSYAIVQGAMRQYRG